MELPRFGFNLAICDQAITSTDITCVWFLSTAAFLNELQGMSQEARSHTSSGSDSSMPQGGAAMPPPPAPPPQLPEPTWPPDNPKLGVPPGVPRERKQVTVKPVPYQRGPLTKEQVWYEIPVDLVKSCQDTCAHSDIYSKAHTCVHTHT